MSITTRKINQQKHIKIQIIELTHKDNKAIIIKIFNIFKVIKYEHEERNRRYVKRYKQNLQKLKIQYLKRNYIIQDEFNNRLNTLKEKFNDLKGIIQKDERQKR